MTPEEFAKKMKEIAESKDYKKFRDSENLHMEADMLLCRVLIELGYIDGVKIFKEMEKWYA